MPLTTLFRVCVILSIALAATGSFLDWIFPSLLSNSLQEYVQIEAEKDLTTGDIVLTLISLQLILLTISAYIGLFFWRNWARHLYLILGSVAYILALFTGDHVYSAPAFVLYDISTALYGFTLALLYFSPLRDRFKKTAEQGAAANP